MDVTNSDTTDTEMLLLMDQAVVQKGDAGNQPNYVQLAPTYDTQQFVMQTNCEMDMESFDDLLTNQGISLENSELSVIEQDGQQYILLPNVSVAQVLQPGDVLSTSDVITPNDIMTPSNVITSNNVINSQSVNEVVPSSQISILEPTLAPQLSSISGLTSNEEQLKATETQLPNLSLNTEPVATQSNNLMAIHRIVPSLCPNPIPGPVSPLSCQVCEFKADDELTLDTHMEEHRRNLGEKIYKGSKENSLKKTPRKGKRGRKKRNTCRFIRSVAPQGDAKKGPFTCSVCGVQIHMISVYKRHMKDHLAEKAHKCHVCSDSFNVKENLTLHCAIHSERGDNGYVCPACQRTFMRIASLKAHLAMHLQDETMICTECGDEFSLKSELDLHMEQHKRDLQLHLGEREDKGPENKSEEELRLCNDVDDIFTSEGYDSPFKEVMKKRNRKKAEPQRCMFCDKMFQKESQFKRHVLIHTGEKPFSCSTCGRSFNQSGALKIHMMMHSGSKPYTCPHCPQIYTQRGNLRVHLARVHSSVNRYPCVECSCVFKTLGSLNSHVTKYHKKMTDSAEVHFSLSTNNVTRSSEIISDAMTLSSGIVTDSEGLNTNHDITIDTSNGSRKDGMDVIQQLLHSLNDSAPKEVNSLEKSPNKQDIVRQALRDSGVNHTLEKAARIDNSEQHGVVEMQLHGDEDTTLLKTSSHSAVHQMLDNDNDNVMMPEADGDVEVTTGLQTTQDTENATVLKELNDDANVTQQPTNGSVNEATSLSNSTDTSRPGHVSGVYMSMRTSGQDRTWRVRRINGVRWHQCMYCTKEFKKPSDLVRHIRVHTHERPYTCTTCMKSFAVKTSLTAHEKIHLGFKPYKCQVCSKSFSTSGSLKVHIRLHTGARPFKCPQCDLSFRTTGHRHNHLKSHIRGTAHKKLHKPRKDITCLLPRTPPVTLEKSIRLSEVGMPLPSSPDESTDDRAYVCTVCGKSFKKWCHLKQHMRSHTGERPYTCIQCGKAFASSSILKAHMRVHTGHKPFHCVECNQSFASHHTLKRHMTIHSQSRPFMCPYCQKTFKTNGTCKKHIETHRNEVTQQAMHSVTVAADSTQSTIDPSALLHLSSLEAGENMSCDDQLCNITTTSSANVTVAHNCVATTDDVTTGMNLSDDAMDFDSNPTLAQIDPNIIQDLTQLDRFRDPIESNNFVTQFTTTIAADSPADGANEHAVQNTEDLNQIDDLQDPLNFKCRGCSKLFESKERLQLHEEFERSSVLPYPCSVCCHSMACEKSHMSHLESHNTNIIHHCPVCFVSFVDIDGLNAHKQIHNSQQQAKVVRRSGTDATQQSHKPTKEMKRKRSGFYRLSEEQSEILEKTDPNQIMTLSERILLSAVAEKDMVSFAQKPGTRGRFKEYETDGPIHPNVCQFCPKSFRKPSDLARHVRTHTGDKPFKCEICGKCFAIKSTLKCHEKRHVQKKMFRCHICDMMYSAKASLKVHMRLHTGTKPYKCTHCDLTFRTSGHRKNHMGTHNVQPSKSTSASAVTEAQTMPTVAMSSSVENTAPVVASSTDVMQSPAKQQPVLWSDMTLTLPMETFMNSDLFQENDTLQLPMQLGAQGNITLQIDPMLIQPNLTETSPATASVAPSQAGSWPPSSVVIQPVNQLCLQTVTSAGTSAEQSARLMPDIDIAVPSSLTGVSNQILHHPSLSAPSETNSNKQQESQISVNPSILQAVQQLLGNLQNSTNRPQEVDQDLTFTLNSSMPNPQSLHSVGDQTNEQFLSGNQATSDNTNPSYSATQGDASTNQHVSATLN